MIPAPGTYAILTDRTPLVQADLVGPAPLPLPRLFPYQSFRLSVSKAEQRRRIAFHHLPRRLRP